MTKKENLILLGDSITNGFDGKKDLKHNVSYYLAKLLPNFEITNAGVNAGSISGNTERDLTYQVNTHNFKDYQVATIAYGTNDFAHCYETLEIISRILQKNITKIKEENPSILLLGILPTNRFDGGIDNLNVGGLSHYTFAELLETLIKVYQKNNLPILNWRKTAPHLIDSNNYRTTLGDQRLHPNAATYEKMAQVIADFIIANL
ncbi:SGNH/GDSL hydrolase family protein [Fructilactobacillus lindneri]|uniref:SGNH/GDSL hydrolase family protein n=1 Tax=Fructilactobacillus lindneri TaxID=53444 RepID=UPI00081A4E40|nr:SGNH/GDSL hydrolase family protein [Fructilactobacillus lindneri]ANZ57387.1 GDSL family lipase [Fructilactobacillus lindneri]